LIGNGDLLERRVIPYAPFLSISEVGSLEMPSSHTLAPGDDVAHSPGENGSRAQERLSMDVDIFSSTTVSAHSSNEIWEILTSMNMLRELRIRGGIAAT
jgi:hypothetical protein